MLGLDLANFERNSYLINEILKKFNYFFRIFELKDKFRCLANECCTKKTWSENFWAVWLKKLTVLQLLARVESERSVRKKSYPINTIFRPVKNWQDEIIQCYFTTEMH